MSEQRGYSRIEGLPHAEHLTGGRKSLHKLAKPIGLDELPPV
jgi:hypothetical protein